MGIGCADRHCQRVCCVIRLGYFGHFQKQLNHLLYLFFISLAVTGYGLFDLQRSKFQQWYLRLHRRQKYHTSSLRHLQGGLGILGKKQLFDLHHIRAVLSHFLCQNRMNLA